MSLNKKKSISHHIVNIIKDVEEEENVIYHRELAITIGEKIYKKYNYRDDSANVFLDACNSHHIGFGKSNFKTFEDLFKFYLKQTLPVKIFDLYYWCFAYDFETLNSHGIYYGKEKQNEFVMQNQFEIVENINNIQCAQEELFKDIIMFEYLEWNQKHPDEQIYIDPSEFWSSEFYSYQDYIKDKEYIKKIKFHSNVISLYKDYLFTDNAIINKNFKMSLLEKDINFEYIRNKYITVDKNAIIIKNANHQATVNDIILCDYQPIEKMWYYHV